MPRVVEPPVPLLRAADGTWLHAPEGQLASCDGDRHVVCHACGQALAHISAQHAASHQMTLARYRERFGLNRKQPLTSPAMTAQRQAEGHRRAQLPAVQAGLAQGQAMARSGALLTLSHAAQSPGSGSTQRRLATAAALKGTREQQRQSAADDRHARAVQLGYVDVGAYLASRLASGSSAWSMARELRCGNAKTIRRLLHEHTGTAEGPPAP